MYKYKHTHTKFTSCKILKTHPSPYQCVCVCDNPGLGSFLPLQTTSCFSTLLLLSLLPLGHKRWLPHEHASLCVFVCLFVCVCALKVILQSQPVCLLIKVFPHRETVMERWRVFLCCCHSVEVPETPESVCLVMSNEAAHHLHLFVCLYVTVIFPYSFIFFIFFSYHPHKSYLALYMIYTGKLI